LYAAEGIACSRPLVGQHPRREDGRDRENYPNLYIWGNAPNVVPNGSDLLLAQQLTANGGDVRFDQTAKSIASFALVKLASGPTLTTVATLAAPPAAP
jgi:hypothetical protein